MMKNKLMLMLVLVVLALVWAWPAAAQAANVPVYLEEERVATAVARGENYYMPLRPMLEHFGYQPKWDDKEQMLSAVIKDEEILYVWPGRRDYEIDCSKSSGVYNIMQGIDGVPAALLIGGQVYMECYYVSCFLPLDYTMAEDGSAINYTYYYPHVAGVDEETWQRLDLATHTGQVLLEGAELATLELPIYDTSSGETQIVGLHTPGGNYLVRYGYDGWRIREENFYRKTLRSNYFINMGTGKVYQADAVDYTDWTDFVFFSRPTGEIWLSGDEGIWRLEDKPGADAKAEFLQLLPKVQALGLPLQHAYCCWTDGRYMLLGDLQRFAFYDMQENKGLDLTPLLLSDGSADLINQFLVNNAPQFYTETVLAEFWQRLNQFPTTDWEVSQPWLRFDHCTEGVLYFELSYISYANAPHSNRGSYTVSIGLQQLKEML